ncbi:hypothetical protein [Brachybacterium paraconglomeratum]|uniref:hypothetical protein n=1 Tax=Brachybacterium paraconglomeratum TaxID=173362 RepID=UPI003809FA0F
MTEQAPASPDQTPTTDQENLMDPVLTPIIAELAVVAGRTSVGAIRDRIHSAEATKNDREVIAAQSEIINDLIADKNDLVRLGDSLREQFVAQQIGPEELGWVSTKLVPLLERWTVEGAEDDEAREKAKKALEYVKELLDPELLQLAQALGFNYKYAIGEALSELTHQAIVGARQSTTTPFQAEPAGPAGEALDPTSLFNLFGGGRQPGPFGQPQ